MSIEKVQTNSRKREPWADYAKAVGIFLMLLGHNELASKEAFCFIYTFHMPLFFILSGYFVSERKDTFSEWLSKNFKALIIPYLFFYLLTYPFGLAVIVMNPVAHPIDTPLDYVIKPLVGMITLCRTDYSFHTNGPTWFLVVLFLVRVCFYINKKSNLSATSLLITSFISIGILFVVKDCEWASYFRLKSVLLAYPFFAIGFGLNKVTLPFQLYTDKYLHRNKFLCSKVWLLSCGLLLMLICYLFGKMNGQVEMSGGTFGNSIAVMYFNATIGSLGVFFICKALPPNLNWLSFIGMNTLIILGLHSMVQTSLRYVLNWMLGIPVHNYPLSLAVLTTSISIFIIVPIILLLNKYIPTLVGKRK